MRPLRASFVLAILAALLGAPSIASAASNSLRGASVSPTSGSVATVFTFTATYDGKSAATGMTVAAGGAVLPMTHTSGTPEDGTWSGSGTLPAGTWVLVFTASVEQGAAMLLAGPTVTVSGPGMPPATSPGSGGSGGSTPDGGQIEPTDPGGLSTPFPAPAGSSGASPVPAAIQTPGATDAPTGADAPVAGPGSDRADGTPAPGAGSSGTGSSGPGSARPGSAGAGAPGGGSPGGPSAGVAGGSDDDGSSGGNGAEPVAGPADRSAEPEATGAGWFVPAVDERDDDESDAGLGGDGPSADGFVEMVLLIALSGVAAVALAGTALLMAGRRRSGRNPERAAEAARTEAVLHERMLRRARVRLDDDDDPIVAAIGGDDDARHPPDRANPRAGSPEP